MAVLAGAGVALVVASDDDLVLRRSRRFMSSIIGKSRHVLVEVKMVCDGGISNFVRFIVIKSGFGRVKRGPCASRDKNCKNSKTTTVGIALLLGQMDAVSSKVLVQNC